MLTSGDPSHNHMTRRVFLGTGAASAVLATTADSVLAQKPTPAPETRRVKGPRVWLDMDQAELDAAYDQSVWAPNARQIGQALRYQQRGRAHALGRAAALRLWSHPH